MDASAKMAINASLGFLLSQTSENWKKDAQIVIDGCIELPGHTEFNYSRESNFSHQGSVTGYTNEMGDVSIDNSDTERKLTEKWSNFDGRIGYYRIGHNSVHQYFLIRHWKQSGSFVDTQTLVDASCGELMSGGYAIAYNEDKMPLCVVQLFLMKESQFVHECMRWKMYVKSLPQIFKCFIAGGSFVWPSNMICTIASPAPILLLIYGDEK